MKLLWTCCRCDAQAVTEKRPNTVTIENVPRGWVFFPWFSKAYCPQHVTRRAATVTVEP